jgi:methylmalonyl-CoA mutase N-terminal domain/subunit
VEPSEPPPIPIHRVEASVEPRQVAAVQAVRARRDGPRVASLLGRLAAEARDPAVNLMPTTIELVKARATLGEIVARLRDVFGRYVERPIF